jgi:hypothetical protein
LIIFPVFVQLAAEAIVWHGQGAPKILDEYVMTWRAAAHSLSESA